MERRISWVILALLFCQGVTVSAQETADHPKTKTLALAYKTQPRRTMTFYYPDNWKATDSRAAFVIYRCNIPHAREHFRNLGMVVVKPLLAPVNSGQLPKLDLEKIATLPRPRNQVEDAKSAIRFLRINAKKHGIDPNRIVATGTSGGGDLALQTYLNDAFEDPNDDQSISHRPNGLVLYCPAFDGIDIWFVKTSTLLMETKKEAPSFVSQLDQFASNTKEGYSVPLDHRAKLIEKATVVGRRAGIDDDEIERFQKVLELFNARDWQLLHPVSDALQMSASRILSDDPLPPTLIMLGDRDHLEQPQNSFLKVAQDKGKKFELKVFKGGGHSFMMQPAFEKASTLEADRFLHMHNFLPAVAGQDN